MDENYSDRELLDQLKNGNTNALQVLFRRYYQQLCRFIFLFVPENDIVEELSANVFINLWKNRLKAVIQTNLRAYLYRSAKNQAISYLRKKKPVILSINSQFDQSDKKDQSPEAIYIEAEIDAAFTEAFNKLPARAKLAFKLHRFDGLKYAEVAEIMKISTSAVEKNITTALKILHRELILSKRKV